MRTRTVTIDGTRHTIDDSTTTTTDHDQLWLAAVAFRDAIVTRSARAPSLERVLAELTALAGRL